MFKYKDYRDLMYPEKENHNWRAPMKTKEMIFQEEVDRNHAKKEKEKRQNLLTYEILNTAKSYIGQTEIKGNQGFHDKKFENEMINIAGFRYGHAWCAYFAELVWKKAYAKVNNKMLGLINDFFSASVMKTYNNFRAGVPKYGFEISREPVPGALVVWQSSKNPRFGHIGIVNGKINNEIFTSIEGNTNDKGGREGYIVANRKRIYTYRKRSLTLKGFIVPKYFD
jgi:hypothetical protein